MRKSVPVILGLGVAACLTLSMMMQHLVENEGALTRPPYTPAVENKLVGRLVGPVRIRPVPDEDGRDVLVVRARVHAGLDKAAIARVLGREVWFGAMRAGERPADVRVKVDDDEDGAPFECAVPPPGR